MHLSRRLRRDFREVFLIVVGVLIALAANAVWGYFQDRSRERTALQQLYDTTLQNERRVSQALFEDSTSGVHNTLLWNLMRPGVRLDTLRIVREQDLGFWFSDLHPLTGTYAALAQSGDLARIRNKELRAQIAIYGGELDSFMRQWATMIDPTALMIVRDVSRFWPVHDLGVWRTSARGGPPPPMDLDAKRRNPDFDALLENQMMSTINRVGLLTPLRTVSTALRRALGHELGIPDTAAFKPNLDYMTSFSDGRTTR